MGRCCTTLREPARCVGGNNVFESALADSGGSPSVPPSRSSLAPAVGASASSTCGREGGCEATREAVNAREIAEKVSDKEGAESLGSPLGARAGGGVGGGGAATARPDPTPPSR